MRPQRATADSQNLPFFSDAPTIPLKRPQLGNVKRARTKNRTNPAYALYNNLTERSYIGLAIGRRNYLGARSERGMQAAGLSYSLMESARLVGADPAKYLRTAASAALSGDMPLLPHEWVQKD